MDIFFHVSWCYTKNYNKQNVFFEKLKSGIDKFPFKVPFELAKVNSIGNTDYPIVSILVLRGTQIDDSLETVNKLKEWFKICDSPSFEDWESKSARVKTINEYFLSAQGNYKILETIKGN